MSLVRKLTGLCCALAISFSAASRADDERFDYVHTRVWTLESGANFFPEIQDSALKQDWLLQRPSFGVAFSGGGTRSATASLGQLRALSQLRWIEKARYFSANSGGAWTLMPFSYLPDNISDEDFLGDYVEPENIDYAVFTDDDQNSLLGKAVSESDVLNLDDPNVIESLRKGDEAYSNFVAKSFLKPFGLDSEQKFFSLDQASVQQILANNPELNEDDFYIARENRPFFMAVGTMLAMEESAEANERYLFEATPLYVGVRESFEFQPPGGFFSSGGDPHLYGGGYVEPFGYDSKAPKELTGDVFNVRLKPFWWEVGRADNLRYRFTLRDVLGMTSAAPQATKADRGLRNLIFPEFRHWTVDQQRLDTENFDTELHELQHGDGGDIDNLAILPMLARQVENILVFINSAKRFEPNPNISNTDSPSCEQLINLEIVDDVISLFCPIEKLAHNVVFADPEQELKKLVTAFASRRQGKQPLVYCQNYEVVENRRQSIFPDNYRPNICWVYLDRTLNWIEQISVDSSENRELINRSGPFDNFPHYRTFLEEGFRVITLEAKRVHALSNLTAWTVFDCADYIAEGLPTAQLSRIGSLEQRGCNL